MPMPNTAVILERGPHTRVITVARVAEGPSPWVVLSYLLEWKAPREGKPGYFIEREAYNGAGQSTAYETHPDRRDDRKFWPDYRTAAELRDRLVSELVKPPFSWMLKFVDGYTLEDLLDATQRHYPWDLQVVFHPPAPKGSTASSWWAVEVRVGADAMAHADMPELVTSMARAYAAMGRRAVDMASGAEDITQRVEGVAKTLPDLE